jgi:hypothetical protein
LLEIIKIVITFLSGGAAGALLKEWFSRRKGKVQPISLIERVNRSVSPELEGITLARLVGDEPNRHLEALRNLREYQLTLRNTSSINLQNIEIQFEFPSTDVEDWVSRPSMSKTALVPIETDPTAPGETIFRWRIPHLPAGDSIEFTFRAVNPPSGDYEVALYNSDAVIIEKVIGEPPPKTTSVSTGAWITIIAAMVISIGFIWLIASGRLVNSSGEKFSAVKEGGCDLRVVSLYDQYGTRLNSPWRIKDRIFNVGTQGCVIQFGQISQKAPFTIGSGDVFEREWIVERVPVLVRSDLSVGLSDGTMKKIPIQIYAEQ